MDGLDHEPISKVPGSEIKSLAGAAFRAGVYHEGNSEFSARNIPAHQAAFRRRQKRLTRRRCRRASRRRADDWKNAELTGARCGRGSGYRSSSGPVVLDLEGGAEVEFFVFACQLKEVQEIGVTKHKIGRHAVLVPQRGQVVRNQLVRPLAHGRAFVKQMTDFVPKRPHVPALGAAQLCIEVALERFVKRDKLDEVAPGQITRQRRDNFRIRERFGELDHPTKSLFGVARPELGGQLSRQRRDNSLTVSGPLILENILPNTCTDVPVEANQRRIEPRAVCSWAASISERISLKRRSADRTGGAGDRASDDPRREIFFSLAILDHRTDLVAPRSFEQSSARPSIFLGSYHGRECERAESGPRTTGRAYRSRCRHNRASDSSSALTWSYEDRHEDSIDSSRRPP
jgi:hypothetical protein